MLEMSEDADHMQSKNDCKHCIDRDVMSPRNAEILRTKALISYHRKRVHPQGQPSELTQAPTITGSKINSSAFGTPSTGTVAVLEASASDLSPVTPTQLVPGHEKPPNRLVTAELNQLHESWPCTSTRMDYFGIYNLARQILRTILGIKIGDTSPIRWEEWGTSIYATRPEGTGEDPQSRMWQQELLSASNILIRAYNYVRQAVERFEEVRVKHIGSAAHQKLVRLQDELWKLGSVLWDIRTRDERGRMHLEKVFRKKKLVFFQYSTETPVI